MTPKMILALALLSALPVQAKIEAMDRIEHVLESKFQAEPPACDAAQQEEWEQDMLATFKRDRVKKK